MQMLTMLRQVSYPCVLTTFSPGCAVELWAIPLRLPSFSDEMRHLMDIFLTLLGKLVPLYALIALGFLAGRVLQAQKDTVASLLLYILSPFVVFHGVFTTPANTSMLSLPVLFFAVCCALSLAWNTVGTRVWQDSTRGIFAYTSATGNTGYFGIPVAIALFGEEVLGIMVLSILGFVLFENTLGFYCTARGNYSMRESLRRLLCLPTVYAFVMALAAQALHIPASEGYTALAANMRGAFSVLGMMIIGMGIADMRSVKLDYVFFGLCFVAKFIVWPLVAAFIVWMDSTYIHFYTEQIHNVIILLSITPLAANTVVLATALKAQPEKASLAVLLSTVFALFFIPAISLVFLH